MIRSFFIGIFLVIVAFIFSFNPNPTQAYICSGSHTFEWTTHTCEQDFFGAWYCDPSSQVSNQPCSGAFCDASVPAFGIDCNAYSWGCIIKDVNLTSSSGCWWASECGDGVCDNPGSSCCYSDCRSAIESSWSWSACNQSCGPETKYKIDRCGGTIAGSGTDCGNPPCAWCGDGSCNGSENCGTCYQDCAGSSWWPGTCSVSCGIGIEYQQNNCGNTGTTRACTRGSWGVYSLCTASCNGGTRTRSWSCAPATGISSPETTACNLSACDPEVCDDNNQCAGFENCTDCIQDFNLVCAGITAWWQVRGGLIGAQNDNPNSFDTVIKNNMPDDTTCNEGTDCIIAISATDLDKTTDTDGFIIMGSGEIETNGYTTERLENISATGTSKTRYEERYQYFYRNSPLGLNPNDDFSGSAGDALKPGSSGDYYSAGDLTIQNNWNVTSGEKYIIFVDGNLTLNGDNTDQLITVETGGFIAFIVTGDIIIEESLGNSTLDDLTPNLSGVFIADGIIDIQTRGFDNGGDDRFVGEGVFAGWSGVDLNRSFTGTPGGDIENTDKPVEVFIYRPDFLVNLPKTMSIPIRIWQETN